MEGDLANKVGPQIYSGKTPNDLPDLHLGKYCTSTNSIKACTGPDKGLCEIKRNKLHFSAGPDIDFIDSVEELKSVRTSTKSLHKDGCAMNDIHDKNANDSKILSRKSSFSVKKETLENENVGDCNKNSKENIEKQNNFSTPIDNVIDWEGNDDDVYGLSVSLYEKNIISNEHTGSPIADCFAIVSREDCSVMVLADGVNWGKNARIAAQAAIFGCIEYLNTAIFGVGTATTTREVFVSLLRSFWEAHACILETEGSLTTLTCAVVLPLASEHKGQYVVCACNVGDSLGYVYSKSYGVREFTQGSHDIQMARDMRDALGALGGAIEGNKPELSNLTLSLTIVEPEDIIFLTSDGISDNFDPVVGKFAEIVSPDVRLLSSQQKIQKKPSNTFKMVTKKETIEQTSKTNASAKYVVQNRSTKNITAKQNEKSLSNTRPKYIRSRTFIEPRSSRQNKSYARSASGLPLVTCIQRHDLSLLRMNDLFEYGINGASCSCDSAKKLCHLLIDFVQMITAAKRKLLEQDEIYYKINQIDGSSSVMKELSKVQQRRARKKVVESFEYTSLPGKLDHASCCAWKVPSLNMIAPTLSVHQTKNYTETNF